MPRLQSFYDNAPFFEPEGGVLFHRKRWSKEFVSASGIRIDVRDRKRSFLCYVPTVIVSEARGWTVDLREWKSHMGSIRFGNYAVGPIKRFGPGEPDLLTVRISTDWSKSEVTGPGIHLVGFMDDGRYAFKDEQGKIVVRGWKSWRDSHVDKGIAEFFWYDDESCGDWWPALMLLVTEIALGIRLAAEPLGD